MSQLLRTALATVCAAALGAPGAAPAAPPRAVTFPYPAAAPVVVQLNGLGRARERLLEMLKAALPEDDFAALGKLVDDGVSELLANRKLTAVPKEARAFFVVNDLAGVAGDPPAISLLVPVTGYKEFRESFLTADELKSFAAGRKGIDELTLGGGGDRTVYLVDLKGYVALTPNKDTAETYAKNYARATTAALAPNLARSFQAADLAAFVNLDVINDQFGDQIRGVRGFIDLAIQQGRMGEGLPGLNKKQVEAVKSALNGVLQAVEDGRAVLLTAEFRPEGLNLQFQAQFAADTTSARLLKAETPGPLADVAKLPVGLRAYTGSALGRKLSETLAGLNQEFAPADDDPEGNAALEKRLAELAAAGLKGDIATSGVPYTSLDVATYDDPKKAAAALVGCYRAVSAGGRIQSAVLKAPPRITADAQKFKGFTFTEVRLTFDFDGTVEGLPDPVRETTLNQLKRDLTEKTTLWIGTDGTRVVRVVAKDWAAASALLDRLLAGTDTLGDTDGYQATRKNLPADASLLLMFDTGQNLAPFSEMMSGFGDALPRFPKFKRLKPGKGDATFIGTVVALKGDTATADVFVPTAALAMGYKLVGGVNRNTE